MKLISKASTLKEIKLKNGIIPDLLIFNCLEYQKNKKKIIDKIKKKFNHKIAIRSSFLDEDTSNSSNAGKYKSFLSIDVKDEENIINKINEVLKSKKKIHKKDIFFIQSMVQNMPFLYKFKIFRSKKQKEFNENVARAEGYKLSIIGNFLQAFLIKFFPDHFCNIYLIIAEK